MKIEFGNKNHSSKNDEEIKEIYRQLSIIKKNQKELMELKEEHDKQEHDKKMMIENKNKKYLRNAFILFVSLIAISSALVFAIDAHGAKSFGEWAKSFLQDFLIPVVSSIFLPIIITDVDKAFK